MWPLNDNTWVTGLICGILFGFVLENAGFGSAKKLTAQFRLTDWSVFKVMFMAIVVAALGLYLFKLAGWIRPDAVFVPNALLVAAAIGGVLVGAGFAVGGYCPGTSVVGLFSGRLDALVFLLGLLLGTFAFAATFGPALESVMAMAELETGNTFTDQWGISEPLVLGVMVLALIAVFYLGSLFERRGGGVVDAKEAIGSR